MTPNQPDALITEICQWSNKSVALLYDNFYRALVNYAMQYVKQHLAEDIVQEVFAGIWQRKPSFDHDAQLVSYLYNSTHNTALNHLRHENVENAYCQEQLSLSKEIPSNVESDTLNEEEIYRQLFLAIDQLPARQREVFLLAMDGKKNREIAEQLQISAETVKVQKRRAVSALRKKLTPAAFLLIVNI